jgi:uncharacterized membrane protein
MRGWLLTFGSLGVWAGWFLTAYGLHGFQCAGPVEVSRQTGQWVQIGLFFGALLLCAGLVWLTWTRRIAAPEGLTLAAFWLNVIGLVAVVLTGAAVFYVAPC